MKAAKYIQGIVGTGHIRKIEKLKNPRSGVSTVLDHKQVKLHCVFAHSTGSSNPPRLILLVCGVNGKVQHWPGLGVGGLFTLC